MGEKEGGGEVNPLATSETKVIALCQCLVCETVLCEVARKHYAVLV